MVLWLFLLLFLSIAFIVLCTARFKLNPFIVLFVTALGVGLLAGLPLDKLVDTLKEGFGETMKKIGLVIILGTILGVILEKTSATMSMANYLLNKVGEKNAPAAISLTGFMVGLPIFCDSGFIILNGLNQSLVRRSHFSMPLMATCLATSLFAVHCLVPPHPGISAAGSSMGAELGLVMLSGMAIAAPLASLGYWWAKRMSGKFADTPLNDTEPDHAIKEANAVALPSPGLSFLPVILPIALIGIKSLVFLGVDEKAPKNLALSILSLLGDPIMALFTAAILAILCLVKRNHWPQLNAWFSEGVEKSGPILAIIAGGGVFGAMLKATKMSDVVGASLSELNLGLFFPFALAALLKTAQGSSTVAVMTSAVIVAPALAGMGLDSEWGRVLAVLALGAGSMVVSHANDAYFWVISTFSNVQASVLFRLYTFATALMGLLAQLLIWLLGLIVL
jgi:gluconate:H+ symporter, GntP family